jgi:hypothetical protein
MILKILIILGILILLPLFIALFVRKNYVITRDVNINRPLPEVFDYLKHLKNQKNFSVWESLDPEMKQEYKGADATPGFIMTWESKQKKVGKGEQEIKSIREGKQIDSEVRFIEPFASTARASLITEAVNEKVTHVSWRFEGRMKYPMNLMLLFMNMDKMVGRDLQTGLENLKKLMEKE